MFHNGYSQTTDNFIPKNYQAEINFLISLGHKRDINMLI